MPGLAFLVDEVIREEGERQQPVTGPHQRVQDLHRGVHRRQSSIFVFSGFPLTGPKQISTFCRSFSQPQIAQQLPLVNVNFVIS